MIKTAGKIVIAIAVLSLLIPAAWAKEVRTMKKSFDAVERVRINTVSGDCTIEKSTTGKVEVEIVYDVHPDDSFEPTFKERTSSLRLGEEWHGRSSSGNVRWTVAVPEETRISFESASGDFEANGIKGEFDCETASGDLEFVDCNGEFDLSTASGDIEMENCEGVFQTETASGRISLENCEGDFQTETASGNIHLDNCRGHLMGSSASGDVKVLSPKFASPAAFATASGSVVVVLDESLTEDLRLSSASGRATLDYDGNKVTGDFEFIAKYRSGRIRSPFDFDDEERFRRHGDKYVRKILSRGSGGPEVLIETASGAAILKDS